MYQSSTEMFHPCGDGHHCIQWLEMTNASIFCEDVWREYRVICLFSQHCPNTQGTGIYVEGEGDPVVLMQDENSIFSEQKRSKPCTPDPFWTSGWDWCNLLVGSSSGYPTSNLDKKLGRRTTVCYIKQLAEYSRTLKACMSACDWFR